MSASAEEVEHTLHQLRLSLLNAKDNSLSEGTSSAHETTVALEKLLRAHTTLDKVISSSNAPQLHQLKPQVNSFNQSVRSQYRKLHASTQKLQGTVDEARAVVGDLGNGMESSEEAAQRLLRFSHKLAYSSYSPLLGTDLIANGPFMPPFPSVFHMQLSKLNNFALIHEAAQREKVQRDKDAAVAVKVAATQMPPVDALAMPAMPADWKPGDPIPMPPNWQPGDAIPLPPVLPPDAPSAPPLRPVESKPLPIILDLDTGVDDEFVLNAEAVDSDSDESSDDEDDEEGAATADSD